MPDIREAAQRVKERAETESAKHAHDPSYRILDICIQCGDGQPCPERQAHLDTARDAQSILDALDACARHFVGHHWDGDPEGLPTHDCGVVRLVPDALGEPDVKE